MFQSWIGFVIFVNTKQVFMKDFLKFCILSVLILVSSCSGGEEYLNINPEWFQKEWKIEGKIGNQVVVGSKFGGLQIYYDEQEDAYILKESLLVSHYQEGATLQPGQLTFGSDSHFIIMGASTDKLTLRRLNGDELTKTAIVRFLRGEQEGLYIFHVNYEGKDYTLSGFSVD